MQHVQALLENENEITFYSLLKLTLNYDPQNSEEILFI